MNSASVSTEMLSCKVCNATFSASSNLSRHKNIHKNKYFNCNLCGKHFTRKDHLSNHVRKLHDVQFPSKYEECFQREPLPTYNSGKFEISNLEICEPSEPISYFTQQRKYIPNKSTSHLMSTDMIDKITEKNIEPNMLDRDENTDPNLIVNMIRKCLCTGEDCRPYINILREMEIIY